MALVDCLPQLDGILVVARRHCLEISTDSLWKTFIGSCNIWHRRQTPGRQRNRA